MSNEYEKLLDEEAAHVMENITYPQIVEALTHSAISRSGEKLLEMAMQKSEHHEVGEVIIAMCYSYYRDIADYKHSNNIKENDLPFGEEYGPRT